jgi:hypothetical protein
VVAARHNELSNESWPTCTRVLPMLELLMSEWEDLLRKLEYEHVYDALKAGITLLEKYYWCAGDTDAYFIAHGEFVSHGYGSLTHMELSSRSYSQGGIS